MTELRRQDFDFSLPPDCIAQAPAMPREAARLLHIQPNVRHDRTIADLPTMLRAGDLLVVNDTRVIPARLFGQRGTVPVEVLLHQALGQGVWQCFARPGKRLRVGDAVQFAPDFVAQVQDKLPDGQCVLNFSCSAAALFAKLAEYGVLPLPPYIKRAPTGQASDQQDYQTMFAAHDGAVAAPTAGLHFTPALMATLAAQGVQRTAVTLHVGAGTFLPVKAERLADHTMHAEWGSISAAAAASINATRAAGGRVIAIGTTALRLLESAHSANGQTQPFTGTTDIFLYPGKPIRSIAALFTNFHLPQSTLFMLTCALMGTPTMQAAYQHAIANRYRFYSYGDACLLEP
jgi:S-adenosylmethionine:tRNA ribosyltransferase-isomerase